MRHLGVLKCLPALRPIGIPTRQERVEELRRAGFTAVRDLKEAALMGTRLGIIATDTGRHLGDSLAALEQGLDLLVEKPLAPDARAAEQLRRRAQGLGRRLLVGCVLRFSESLNRFRALLPELGELHSVEISCRSYLPDWRPGRNYRDSYSAREIEGGVLRDLIHEVDYAGWLFGWPEQVQGRLRNLGRLGIEAEETADLSWETPAGAAISLHLDYLTRPHQRRMIAFGEKGTLQWDGTDNRVTGTLAGKLTQVIPFTETREQMLLRQAQSLIGDSGVNGFCPATGLDGVMALAICDAARKSSQSGRQEKVEGVG